METWQIVMLVMGVVVLIAYMKRRSDRLGTGD
jgi:hypothetical protein